MLEFFWLLAARWGCTALEAQKAIADAVLEALLISAINGGGW